MCRTSRPIRSNPLISKSKARLTRVMPRCQGLLSSDDHIPAPPLSFNGSVDGTPATEPVYRPSLQLLRYARVFTRTPFWRTASCPLTADACTPRKERHPQMESLPLALLVHLCYHLAVGLGTLLRQ